MPVLSPSSIPTIWEEIQDLTGPSVSEDWPDNVVNSLGNLVLLSEQRNAALSNKNFADKKHMFITWGNAVPDSIIQSNDWTPEAVINRINNMSDMAYNTVWKI